MLKKTHLLLAALILGIVSASAEVAKPAQSQTAEQTVKAAPKAEGEAKKPHRRRPNYRRKPSKPKQNPEG